MSKKKNESTINGVEPTVEPTVAEPKTGKVTKCTKLNIRKSPKLDRSMKNVICTIPVGEEVTINEEASVEKWFNVTLKNGRTGFCMKEYITVE